MRERAAAPAPDLAGHLDRARRELFSRTVVGVYAAMGLFLLVTKLVTMANDIPFYDVSGDTVVVLEAPLYIGFVSRTGLMLWSAAVGVCLLTYAVLRASASMTPDAARFFLTAGLLTALLLVDDAFLLHDELGPYVIGIPQVLIYAALAAAVLGWAVVNRRHIAATRTLPLAIAVICGGLSIALDVAVEPIGALPGHSLFEDGFKFVAIGSWLFYFGREALAALRFGGRGAGAR